MLDGEDRVIINSETHSCWSNAFRCFHNTATMIGTVMNTECEIRVESVPSRPKEKKEAVVTFKDIVLKKSILLPPICRGIFTLKPGTAKPFLTVLFEPNLYPMYV